MFGRLLKSVSWQVKADLRRSLKSNPDYKYLSWSPVERVFVSCSTHYIKAIIALWMVAAGAIFATENLRPILYPFAVENFKEITQLSGWMSNLLGSQLTIIGIVFPLVVGLISVLFQKKSARIHIQSAYQLQSGYMFSGLSGLSLSAFILIGGLTSSLGDKYLNTAFAVTAFVWMLFNILLSIWFFVTSLSVLDEDKRVRIMNKYFLSKIVNDYIKKSYIQAWLRYPGVYIGDDYLNNIKILPYSLSKNEEMDHIKCEIRKNDVILDVYTRPLLFLLRRLRAETGQDASLLLLPSFSDSSYELTLLSSKGVKPVSKLWRWLYRYCIVTGKPDKEKIDDDITFDFFSESYDALNDKNIGVFRSSVKRLTDTYASIKNSVTYADGLNYLDEVKKYGFSLSFSESFHYDLRKFIRETVKSTETSGEYFHEAMYIPSQVIKKSESSTFLDFKQYLLSLFRVWHVLNEWKAGVGVTPSASQEQTHQDLVRNFIGVWEGWSMGQTIGKSGNDDFTSRLMYHLHCTVRLLIPSVVADNVLTTRHAHDVLCLWFNQRRFTRHWEEEYRWHSFFLTPDYLSQHDTSEQWMLLLRGNSYKRDAALSIMFANALSDMRLLISGYLIAHFEPQKNLDLADLVNHLISSKLYEERDVNEMLTPGFRSAVDIIDVILRIEHCNLHADSNWFNGLSETIEAMNSFNERPLIPGRTYTSVSEDLGSLYGAFALLAIKLARPSEQVTQRVNEALTGGLFSYSSKLRIITILERLRRDTDIPYSGYLISGEEYKTNVLLFNDILSRYIEIFTLSKNADIIAADIDTERLRNIDIRLTQELPTALSEDILLSHFKSIEHSDYNFNWQIRNITFKIPKDFISKDLNINIHSDFPSISEVKRSLLHRLHFLLGKEQAKFMMEVHSLEAMLSKVAKRSSDQEEYLLIVYGSKFSEELRELVYQAEKHSKFDIHVDALARGLHSLPFRINNCQICQVYNSKHEYTLMVSKKSFGELRLFRYPDGTLFNTFYCSSEDPIEGVMNTLWEVDMEVKGPLVARFEHI